MKTIDNRQIEAAIDAITTNIADKEGIVPKEMKGYVSSFGAAMIQSGLIPAIIFYGAEKSDKDKAPERPKMIKSLVEVINTKRNLRGKEVLNTDLKALLKQLLPLTGKTLVQKEFSEAAIAFKLALRTFKEKKED